MIVVEPTVLQTRKFHCLQEYIRLTPKKATMTSANELQTVTKNSNSWYAARIA